MKKMKETKSQYSPAVRILALALSLLVTGGVLAYIAMFFLNLF